MSAYVSMLRGINVAGHYMIKMPELAVLYRSLGFEHVRTWLQSGNVMFDTPDPDAKALEKAIERKIRQDLGLTVTVLIRTPAELRRIIDYNTFLRETGIDAAKLHVTFLSGAPARSAISKINETQHKSDRFVMVGNEVYLHCPGGYGQTKFSNAFFERKLGVAATTRNWKTVNALLQLAEDAPG